uniref:Protein white n=1 Tax=Laodelphax striatellus TaxID=195883 RepID=A0A158V6Z1_LAOST|nr:white-like protein [Laodelphax striatellus]
MSRTPEKQPLLVQAKHKTNGATKPSYHTIPYETSPQSADTCALHLDNLQQKAPPPPSNGYKSIYPRLNGGGGDKGGNSPPGTPVFPTENITYSWHNINVFTSSRESRRSRMVNCVRNMVSRNGEYSRVGHRKHILNNVTGVAYPGELIALMGSSGAGKTTLLNSLTFRNSQDLLVSGQRAINGIPVTANTLASLSAYVQQDDLFVGTLTVREHLVFQALVRMDRHLSYEQRMSRVEEVIEELMLTSCQNTIIGVPGKIKGISGGEMKRLSFASEVLTNPPLLFCDEPTSGLDSYMAQNVVSVLKSLANKGKTLICTIHQPSSEVYAMFDKILLMAEGRVAFLGSLDQATDFFRTLGAGCPSHYNPADFFIQLLAVVPNSEESCRNMIELVCDTFATSEIGTKLALEAEPKFSDHKSKSMFVGAWGDPFTPRALSPYKASWYNQFRAVFWRSWISVWKEPVLIKVRMLQTFMVALMVGIIYFGQENDQDGVMNINGALFICITNMTFQNVFAVISVFCAELPVFLREHFNGMYRTDVYFLCKTLAEVPIFLAIPALFTSVMYYMVGLNPAPSKFVQAGIIITLVSCVVTSFGYLISCVSSSVSVALFIGPPVVIPFLLFGGFFLNAGSVPPYFEWLSNLSWFKYGNEALLINQWGDVTDIKCTRTNATCPRDGHIILETYNFSESDYLMDYLCLIGLIVGFRTFAFLSLLYRTSGKKH